MPADMPSPPPRTVPSAVKPPVKASQIAQSEVAAQADTQDAIPHGKPTQAPPGPSHADQELQRLGGYLRQHYAGELSRSNYVHNESVVDVAIRLLTSLSAATLPDDSPRCAESYCNHPLDHIDEHGWVVRP